MALGWGGQWPGALSCGWHGFEPLSPAALAKWTELFPALTAQGRGRRGLPKRGCRPWSRSGLCCWGFWLRSIYVSKSAGHLAVLPEK